MLRLNLQLFGGEADLSKQKTISIRKGIVNLESKITLHEDKIAHLEQYYSDWFDTDPIINVGRIKHWEKEIDNFKLGIANRLKELEVRGEK